MRKYLAVPVLGALLMVLGTVSAADASSSSTYYAGKNAQNEKLLFSVDQTSNGPMFDPVFTNMIDRCPVGGGIVTIGFIFQGFLVPIHNGKFSLSLTDLSDRFKWTGTVTSKSASGKQTFDLAAFDSQGGLQDCATGAVSWKAQALVSATAKPAAPKPDYVVTVTKAANGAVHFSVGH